MIQTKKLIEVALPLEAINRASAREKSIRHGHPSTLHLWWARRPLAAARAVIFAQMVDDPSSHPHLFPTEAEQSVERKRLFGILEDLVQWENSNNIAVLEQAREAILQSWQRTERKGDLNPGTLRPRDSVPVFHDPFAGGGSLPLEAQRLGLRVLATDLNPVSVLINKAMLEIPSTFAASPPMNPDARADKRLIEKQWAGAEGLAADVRYYGHWIREQAEKRIGCLYPKASITAQVVAERQDLKKYQGQQLTVIAWIWARTVESPNPGFSAIHVPLASTFVLSKMKANEAYVAPVVDGDRYRFVVEVGKPPAGAANGTKQTGANFRCILSGTPITADYIRGCAQAGSLGTRLLAVVAEGERGRVYLSPTTEMEQVAKKLHPQWQPDVEFYQQALGFRVGNYGMKLWSELFTQRQLVALSSLMDLVGEAVEQARLDAQASVTTDSEFPGERVDDYSNALAVYLSLIIDRVIDYNSSLCTWHVGGPTTGTKSRNTFSRQALSMTWDFAEVNPLSTQSGSLLNSIEYTCKSIAALGVTNTRPGVVLQRDAGAPEAPSAANDGYVISTDPPYYDNIGYADLSDFFYVWLRRALKDRFPELFATVAVPKIEELVATPARHGGREKAETFFLEGMSKALTRLSGLSHPDYPVTIYYAFKQSERSSTDGVGSTGWETFLGAVCNAGFSITGTWPMRTELGNRMRGAESNALASSVVLVCRKQSKDAPVGSRREFISVLRSELPLALGNLQRANIAPVDLAQSAIGPGMAVFTRYQRVLDAAGNTVSIREALGLINEALDSTLAEQEGDFDSDSRWALAWFEQSGFDEGDYGVAETLSKAKNTSIKGLEDSGILHAKAGKVRLLKPEELPPDWDPVTDSRLSIWEMVHHLVRVLEGSGESAAADLVKKLGTKAEVARELCYRLYTICERKKRANEARSYNNLVQSWPEITRLAREAQSAEPEQRELF